MGSGLKPTVFKGWESQLVAGLSTHSLCRGYLRQYSRSSRSFLPEPSCRCSSCWHSARGLPLCMDHPILRSGTRCIPPPPKDWGSNQDRRCVTPLPCPVPSESLPLVYCWRCGEGNAPGCRTAGLRVKWRGQEVEARCVVHLDSPPSATLTTSDGRIPQGLR